MTSFCIDCPDIYDLQSAVVSCQYDVYDLIKSLSSINKNLNKIEEKLDSGVFPPLTHLSRYFASHETNEQRADYIEEKSKEIVEFNKKMEEFLLYIELIINDKGITQEEWQAQS